MMNLFNKIPRLVLLPRVVVHSCLIAMLKEPDGVDNSITRTLKDISGKMFSVIFLPGIRYRCAKDSQHLYTVFLFLKICDTACHLIT